MKKKINIFIFLTIFLIVLSGCTKETEEKVEIVGEVESGQKLDEKTKEDMVRIDNELKKIFTQYQNAPTGSVHSKDALKSYYRRTSLSEKEGLVYDEIYTAISDVRERIVLSESVSESQLKKVMTVLFLDTPELFHLDNKYSYRVGLDGKIESIKVFYLFPKEKYVPFKEAIITSTSDTVKKIRTANTLDAITMAAKTVASYGYDSSKDGKSEDQNGFKGNYANTIYGSLYGDRANALGAAKLINYLLRTSGVDSAIKVGVLSLDNPLTRYGYDLPTYSTFDRERIFKEYSVENDKFVELNLEGLHFFNIIQVSDNDWVNYDHFLNKIFSVDFSKKASLNDGIQLIDLTSDYQMAQTRSFYINEELLGIVPHAHTPAYSQMYRNGYYLKGVSKELVPHLQAQVVKSFVKNGNFLYQFEDYESFTMFTRDFQKKIDEYNKTSEHPVQSYSIYTDPLTFTVVGNNLVTY